MKNNDEGGSIRLDLWLTYHLNTTFCSASFSSLFVGIWCSLYC